MFHDPIAQVGILAAVIASLGGALVWVVKHSMNHAAKRDEQFFAALDKRDDTNRRVYSDVVAALGRITDANGATQGAVETLGRSVHEAVLAVRENTKEVRDLIIDFRGVVRRAVDRAGGGGGAES